MMKRIISVLCILTAFFCFCSCGKNDLGKQTTTNGAGVVEYQTVGTFDYSDYVKETESIAVKTGFVNIKTTECYNKTVAKKLAFAELKENEYGYSELKLDRDPTEGIWRVNYIYSSEQTEFTKISVCVNEDGLTQLIVKE